MKPTKQPEYTEANRGHGWDGTYPAADIHPMVIHAETAGNIVQSRQSELAGQAATNASTTVEEVQDVQRAVQKIIGKQ